MKKRLLFVAAVMILIPVVAAAIDVDLIKKMKFITTEELWKLQESKADFVLIDTLSPIEFAEEHIKGAVNLPYIHLKSGKGKLPQDKNKMLIFYCKGPQ